MSIDAHGNIHNTAGRFDGHIRSEPEGALALTIEEIDQAADERAERAAQRERWEHVVDVLGKTSGAIAREWRIDPTNAEDIAQDTIKKMLESQRDIDDQLAQKDSYFKQAARNRATKFSAAYQNGRRSEDIAAARQLAAAEAEFEAANGRRMNKRERDEEAHRVLMSFKPGQRPKDDFHRSRSTLSLDAPVNADGSTTLGDLIEVPEGEPRHDAVDDFAARIGHEIDNGMTTKANARRQSWRLVSIRDGAPQVQEGVLTTGQARKFKQTVANAPGGVLGLLDRWESGEATTDEERALFAPFGDDIDMRGYEKVASTLRRHPALADRLHAEAVAVAAS